MNSTESTRNILLYRLYVIFNEPLFWAPILIVSLQKLAGMSLSDIYYMEAVVLCICVVLDIPSGALADIIGKKRTIIIGRIFLLGSIFFFATMTSASGAWTGNILWAVGYTLQSGADTSLLYETLNERREGQRYKQIQGQALGLRLLLVACCSLLAGPLADIDLRLPAYCCVPFELIPLIASFFLKEPMQTEQYSAKKQVAILKQGVSFVFHSVEVRWMVGFAALIAATSKVWFFTYNPYFELVGVPIAHFGFIFFLANIVAWLSSHYAYNIERILGEKRCILVAIFCVGAPVLLMGLIPIHPFAYLIVVQNIVRGFIRPFVEDYIHHHITKREEGGNIRATVMSAHSTATSLATIAGLAGFGFLTDSLSLLNSLLVLGIFCLVLGGVSYRSYLRNIK